MQRIGTIINPNSMDAVMSTIDTKQDGGPQAIKGEPQNTSVTISSPSTIEPKVPSPLFFDLRCHDIDSSIHLMAMPSLFLTRLTECDAMSRNIRFAGNLASELSVILRKTYSRQCNPVAAMASKAVRLSEKSHLHSLFADKLHQWAPLLDSSLIKKLADELLQDTEKNFANFFQIGKMSRKIKLIVNKCANPDPDPHEKKAANNLATDERTNTSENNELSTSPNSAKGQKPCVEKNVSPDTKQRKDSVAVEECLKDKANNGACLIHDAKVKKNLTHGNSYREMQSQLACKRFGVPYIEPSEGETEDQRRERIFGMERKREVIRKRISRAKKNDNQVKIGANHVSSSNKPGPSNVDACDNLDIVSMPPAELPKQRAVIPTLSKKIICPVTKKTRYLCGAEGCTKYMVSNGVCISHGAPQRKTFCKVDGCTKYIVKNGICIAHGAPQRKTLCKIEGCEKYMVKHGICVSHGAPQRKPLCRVEGCSKYIVKKGVCISHGAPQRKSLCKIEGCTKYMVKHGICVSHGAPTRKRSRKDEGSPMRLMKEKITAACKNNPDPCTQLGMTITYQNLP